jgi:flagellar hook-associated protein 2
MSTSSTASLFTPLQFTGISQYSSDFQSILTRADSIAQIPVTALQNQQSTIQQEQTDLTTLSAAATAVTSTLQAIGNLGSTQALSASSSDTKVLTASNTGATSPTSYSVTNVTSIASPASETSKVSYQDATSTAVSASGSMTLVAGNQTFPITLTAGTTGTNNLTGLVNAINGLTGAGVTASILTTSSGDYLSLAANTPGATALQLIENPQSTLTTASVGSSTVAASATSTATYADLTTAAVSPSGKMELVFGGKSYSISLTSGTNNLAGLVSAINGLGAGVTASTTGTAGQYGLSITANKVGANTLQILENPTNVLTSANQGSNTNFDLNGIAISEANTTVSDLIPGVTLNFTGTTAANETVAVNVATDRTQIQTALQNLVTNYNTLATAETAQFSSGTAGSGAGSLGGNNILYQMQSAMSSLLQYRGSGSMVGLASFGIEMSTSGANRISLNTQTFNALSDSDIASGLQLLGSSTTGIGGLQQTFAAITDPVAGTIAEQQSRWATTSTNLTDQINTKTAQIRANEQTLNRQLQAADASVAELANQQSILNASITSLNFTSYGYNTNNASNPTG